MYDKRRHKLQEVCTGNDITLESVFEIIERERAGMKSKINGKNLKYKLSWAYDVLGSSNDKYGHKPYSTILPNF